MTEDKLLGGLYGLLIGDAAGVPYEFKRPENIPPLDQIDMTPPADFKKGWMKAWSNIPVGTWSDDGSQALCLLETLASTNDEDILDTSSFTEKLIAWYDYSYMAADNNRFDIGNQTAAALNCHKIGGDIEQLNIETCNGNGSLMRALPVGLWYAGEKGSTKHRFLASSMHSYVTHPHARSKICCGIYAEVANHMLQGKDPSDAYALAMDIAEQDCSLDPHIRYQFDIIKQARDKEATGTGYVVDSLWSALYALQRGTNYREVIQHAISLGNDTDTTACIAGGLAGIQYGLSGIPEEWIDTLRDKAKVAPLALKLLERHGITE